MCLVGGRQFNRVAFAARAPHPAWARNTCGEATEIKPKERTPTLAFLFTSLFTLLLFAACPDQVGRRLALGARSVAYGESGVCFQGPRAVRARAAATPASGAVAITFQVAAACVGQGGGGQLSTTGQWQGSNTTQHASVGGSLGAVRRRHMYCGSRAGPHVRPLYLYARRGERTE